jgi:hypothetical protein
MACPHISFLHESLGTENVELSMRPCDLTPPEERQRENEEMRQRRETGRKGQNERRKIL